MPVCHSTGFFLVGGLIGWEVTEGNLGRLKRNWELSELELVNGNWRFGFFPLESLYFRFGCVGCRLKGLVSEVN